MPTAKQIELLLIREEIARRRAIKEFPYFCKLAWRIVEPEVPYTHSWHVDAIGLHLEAVLTGQIRNLVINMPPRMSKSSLVSVMFVAWVWLRYPGKKFLYSSYAASLSIRDSIKCRRLIESDWYRSFFKPTWQLNSDQNTQGEFSNTRQGHRIATSVDGSGTGKGGDIIVCLPYEQIISTDAGPLPIGDIVENKLAVRVLSFNHAKGTEEFAPIEAFEKNTGREVFSFTTAKNRKFSCTAEHPVFVIGKGYIPASNVMVGDACKNQLPTMRERKLKQARQAKKILQLQMQGRSQARRKSLSLQLGIDELRGVWKKISSFSFAHVHKKLLRAGLCRSRSSQKYNGKGKWPISHRSVGWLCERISGSFATSSRAHERLLRRMWQATKKNSMACASYRLQSIQQYSKKLGDALQLLPQKNSCEDVDYIRSIERKSSPTFVYNVRVVKNHNYYAGGVLVHNCDDPHKATDVYSDTKRESVIDWWDFEMSTRSITPKTVARIIVMQRLHPMDLSGHVLKRGGYEHLILPMEYTGKKNRTSIGWEDPRTEIGELLSPARFGPKEIKQLKADLGVYGYAGQEQQDPVAVEGGYIKRAWFKYYDPANPPWDLVNHTSAWDFAASEKNTADYTVGGVAARRAGGVYILDWMRDRMEFPAALAAFKNFCAKHPKALEKRIENKSNGAAIFQSVKGQMHGVIEVNPKGDKLSRLISVSPFIEAGNVYLPQGADWVEDFLKEVCSFSGEGSGHDDQVDTLVMLLDKFKSMPVSVAPTGVGTQGVQGNGRRGY